MCQYKQESGVRRIKSFDVVVREIQRVTISTVLPDTFCVCSLHEIQLLYLVSLRFHFRYLFTHEISRSFVQFRNVGKGHTLRCVLCGLDPETGQGYLLKQGCCHCSGSDENTNTLSTRLPQIIGRGTLSLSVWKSGYCLIVNLI